MMPGGERPLQAEGVADGEHPLADQQVRRVAEDHREERVGGASIFSTATSVVGSPPTSRAS